MSGGVAVELARIVDSHDFDAVLNETLRIHSYHYPHRGETLIRQAYGETCRLFAGNYPGYRECRVQYHDLRHTLDVLLAATRLLDGHNLHESAIPERLANELCLAALLHDSGYMQEEFDSEGTGAKYSRQHEERSMEFTRRNAESFAVEPGMVPVVCRLIASTDLKRQFESIPFVSEEERIAGAILGSADLLGQMADRQYLEKLLFLYYEFREAGIPGYDTEFDILRKTRMFYSAVQERLESSYGGVYRLARDHFRARFGVDEDLYTVAIERQMAYLDAIMADETTNFRHKLRRGDEIWRARAGNE